jgi:phage tail protein X
MAAPGRQYGAPVTARSLKESVASARRRLPAAHRALLEQIGVQEAFVDDWPFGVQAMYETLGEPAPSAYDITGAVAVWLPQRRVVAFNAALLRHVLDGEELAESARQAAVDNIAWHEYGHALSAVIATPVMRSAGPRLVELLPPGLRKAIDYPGTYRRGQVFDEVMANVYALMVSRAVHHNEYGLPRFLHRDVVEAFQAVVPWPPNRP